MPNPDGVSRRCWITDEERTSSVWYARTVETQDGRRRVYASPEAYFELDEDQRGAWVREAQPRALGQQTPTREASDDGPEPEPQTQQPSPATLATDQPALKARGLTKVYESGQQEVRALDGIDVDVKTGEFVSIMGPSGSGKSTLLHVLGLLDTPTSGSLVLEGRRVDGLDRDERAKARNRLLGFVFQAFHLVGTHTATENVVLPMTLGGVPRGERRPRAEELLTELGLGDRLDHRPNELSGGQKQRVALARALALDPAVLLADEPTGNLDSATSADVMALLTRLNRQGRTIIQVTHDRQMAKYGQRIIHLRDGRIERVETASGVPA